MGATSTKLYANDAIVSTANPLPVTGTAGGTPIVTVGAALIVTASPVVSAAAIYAAGDSIGGKITLANAVRVSGGSSRLENIQVLDRANQKPSGYILLFNADPSSATLTDNAAVALSTDDLKVVARIDVSTADYITIDSKAIGDIPYSGRLVKATTGTSLYAAWVALNTPTFAATSDLQIIFKFSAAS